MPHPIVSVENLTHVYQAGTSLEKKALEDVSLQVQEGECVGIVGETGSGKTTLVEHFNGLLKPSSGRVFIEGIDLSRSKIPLVEIRRRVGLVFQYPEHQLFEETVFQEISFVLRQQKAFPPEEIDRRVRSACSWVGLAEEEFFHRSPFQLSGGEMRRVALAGVLVQDPHLLILDEPFVGLDGPGKQEILREIQDLHGSGKTIIVVSHGIDDLIGLVDRLFVLEKGRLLLSGRPAEVFSLLLQSERLHFWVPSVFQLCHSLRSQGWDLPDKIFRVEEALTAIDQFLKKNQSQPAGVH